MPEERGYQNAGSKIFVVLVVALSLVIWAAGDSIYPSWWFGELSIVVGLALMGGVYWLSGVIDDWLRRK